MTTKYTVSNTPFSNFYDARAEAEKQSWLQARPVVVRNAETGKTVYRADIRPETANA
jgi:hypothetical protein